MSWDKKDCLCVNDTYVGTQGLICVMVKAMGGICANDNSVCLNRCLPEPNWNNIII